MCGIWSWAGNNVKKFNKDKFNILGIMNETRGTHSCGISIDGEIDLGVNTQKVYRDFINENMELLDIDFIPTAIGHTRHATGGAHNKENAHPFGFFDSENHADYSFIGVHNGSLNNKEEIAKLNNIDVSERIVTNVVTNRAKIDSEILLEIIFKSRNSENPYKVLEEYNGAAALTFYFTDEPNVVYYYHGASKTYKSLVNATEERPLFYYKESEGSLYTSSIKESLEIIGGTDITIDEFDHNVVYKVTDGDIDNAEKTYINRSSNFQKLAFNSYSGYQNGFNKTKTCNNALTTDPNKLLNLAYESPNDFSNAIPSRIIFDRLKWQRNGHNISGIYAYINNHGFYLLDDNNVAVAENVFKRLLDKPFVDGNFMDGMFKDLKSANVPFKSEDFTDLHIPLHFFHKGVMLKSKLDFEAIKSFKDRIWTERDLSIASKHPVIIFDGVKNHNVSNIFWEGKPYTGTFSIFGSNRAYECINGALKDIIEYKELESSCDLPQDLNKTVKLLENKAERLTEDLNEEEDSKQVQKLLEKFLFSTYVSIPSYISQLKVFKNSDVAKEAIGNLLLIDELMIEMCPELKDMAIEIDE